VSPLSLKLLPHLRRQHSRLPFVKLLQQTQQYNTTTTTTTTTTTITISAIATEKAITITITKQQKV
jgi:hypothetical protein